MSQRTVAGLECAKVGTSAYLPVGLCFSLSPTAEGSPAPGAMPKLLASDGEVAEAQFLHVLGFELIAAVKNHRGLHRLFDQV